MRRCLNGHPVFDDRRSVCACGAPLRSAVSAGAGPGREADPPSGGGEAPSRDGQLQEQPADEGPRDPDDHREPDGHDPAADDPAAHEPAPHDPPPYDYEAEHDAEQKGGHEADRRAPDVEGDHGDRDQDHDQHHHQDDEGPVGGGTERHRTEALSAREAGGLTGTAPDATDAPDAPDARDLARPAGAERRGRSRGPRRRLSTVGKVVVALAVVLLLVLVAVAAGLFSSGSSIPSAGRPATPAPAPRTSAPASSGQVGPALAAGASGAGVVRLQKALALAGFSAGTADGSFGPGTEAMLRAFQNAKGIPATGRADAATWAALPTVR